MTERAGTIMRQLLEALGSAPRPAKVARFTECRDCGNLVHVAARCELCNARLYGEIPRSDGEQEGRR